MKVGIVGASGYSGAELLRLLEDHPQLVPAVATSREFAGRKVSDVYPNLPSDLAFTDIDLDLIAGLDLVFLALPHGVSMTLAPALADRGTPLVDFSADFRLHDADAYPEWFGHNHTSPGTLQDWIYGLPELHRKEIAGAGLVANPGCYPTAVLLALAPLVESGLIDTEGIVVSAASGVSGAGRGVSPGVHFAHVHGSVRAYGFPGHKHTPEIEQELTLLAGRTVRVTFVPHLVPASRGLLATCVAPLAGGVDGGTLFQAARDRYADEAFVRVVEDLPETGHLAGSNGCSVAYRADLRTGRAVAVAAIDNLGKGAAGQALQNANLMLGLPETLGLGTGGLYP